MLSHLMIGHQSKIIVCAVVLMLLYKGAVAVVVVVFVFVVVAIVVEMQLCRVFFRSKLVNKFREKHAKLFGSLTTEKYNCCVNICSGKNCNDDEPTNKTKRS